MNKETNKIMKLCIDSGMERREFVKEIINTFAIVIEDVFERDGNREGEFIFDTSKQFIKIECKLVNYPMESEK